MPGRHASPAGPSFYRDLLTMLGGILAVAVVVFLGLSALSTADTPGTTVTTASSTTTSEPAPTTTREPTTSTSTSTTATSTTVALRAPSAILVQVLNGVGVAGLASEVNSRLQVLGYQTLEPGNYEPVLSQSRVWYVSGFEGEAFELAAEFPDALVEQVSADLGSDADIVVVLGESYQG